MPRTRPPYPEEFRREAIKLALLGDKPQRQLAKDLGISVQSCLGQPVRNPRFRESNQSRRSLGEAETGSQRPGF